MEEWNFIFYVNLILSQWARRLIVSPFFNLNALEKEVGNNKCIQIAFNICEESAEEEDLPFYLK